MPLGHFPALHDATPSNNEACLISGDCLHVAVTSRFIINSCCFYQKGFISHSHEEEVMKITTE